MGVLFIRNPDVDANDFFSNRAGSPLGSLQRNQAGVTAGGPLMIPKVYRGKDRTSFDPHVHGSDEIHYLWLPCSGIGCRWMFQRG